MKKSSDYSPKKIIQQNLHVENFDDDMETSNSKIDQFSSQTTQEKVDLAKLLEIDDFSQPKDQLDMTDGEDLNFERRPIVKKPFSPEKPKLFEKLHVNTENHQSSKIIVDDDEENLPEIGEEKTGMLKFYLLDVYEDVAKNPGKFLICFDHKTFVVVILINLKFIFFKSSVFSIYSWCFLYLTFILNVIMSL